MGEKKQNMKYWDQIDNTVEDMLTKVLGFSSNDVKAKDIEDLTGVVACIRDYVVKILKENGAEFPYVDENY